MIPALFFTTFNKNGYELYGKKWVSSFISVASQYEEFRAEIYYEGFTPTIEHPNITWINYEDVVPHHPEWKHQYLEKTQHTEYVKTMTVRFSHKAFVIQHVLDAHSNDYIIWLDGDCVFKNANYDHFPKNILENKFLACQVEHNRNLNHVESGILVFSGNHSDTEKFNIQFKKLYRVENILKTAQPYDGFVIYNSLIAANLDYVDLNELYGRKGIQSKPEMTFCHPELKSKFVHNIGWEGKTRYERWKNIYEIDNVYRKMNDFVLNTTITSKKKTLNREKLNRLKKLR